MPSSCNLFIPAITSSCVGSGRSWRSFVKSPVPLHISKKSFVPFSPSAAFRAFKPAFRNAIKSVFSIVILTTCQGKYPFIPQSPTNPAPPVTGPKGLLLERGGDTEAAVGRGTAVHIRRRESKTAYAYSVGSAAVAFLAEPAAAALSAAADSEFRPARVD